MKIYLTATQEDYSELMSELEEKGCMWYEEKPTAKNYWPKNEEKTYVMEDNGYLTYGRMEPGYRELYPFIEYKAKGENMKIYHVETQQDYDALMIELEEKGYKWLSGDKPTLFNYWKQEEENSCIKISGKDITFGSIEWHKKEYPGTPIIEYKAKGENMTQKEMKHNIFSWARDVHVAVESFARDMSEAEADLQEAKSSAKKLIEKIDEYLESQKPKFKVGDYVTVYVNSRRKTAKIEKIDELVENNSKVHGLWYDRALVNFKQDYWYSSGLNEFRHARPTEIAEYEAALTFHKHGRKPFEVKKGDILRDDEGNILMNDDNILSADFPKNLKKDYFIRGRYTFLTTAEEVNEWLEN